MPVEKQNKDKVVPLKSPRLPNQVDYLAFYVAIPVLFGIWATPYIVPPTDVLDFGEPFIYVYVCFRAFSAWLIIDLACRCIGHSGARFRFPLWLIFLIGFVVACGPIMLFAYVATEVFRLRNPNIAEFIGHKYLGWNLNYFWTVFKYAGPGLVAWFIAAYGYMKLFNVRLFSYAPDRSEEDVQQDDARQSASDPDSAATALSASLDPLSDTAPDAVPSFLLNSRLPETACVYAIKAEEHYIRIWTEGGTDLLRHRFKDAVNEMRYAGGLQVHRSWWVRLSAVAEFRAKGRAMELTIDALDLQVPVSLSYKQALLNALEERGMVDEAEDADGRLLV